MNWSVEFLQEAVKDLKKLDHSAAVQVLKGIRKVSQNPLPAAKGGYGKPLGNQNGSRLSGLMKIKFRNLGIRVVYKIEQEGNIMIILIISVRADNEVFEEACRRRIIHGL